eukprot:4718983-Prymnesium_polylepis.1
MAHGIRLSGSIVALVRRYEAASLLPMVDWIERTSERFTKRTGFATAAETCDAAFVTDDTDRMPAHAATSSLRSAVMASVLSDIIPSGIVITPATERAGAQRLIICLEMCDLDGGRMLGGAIVPSAIAWAGRGPLSSGCRDSIFSLSLVSSDANISEGYRIGIPTSLM